MYLGRK